MPDLTLHTQSILNKAQQLGFLSTGIVKADEAVDEIKSTYLNWIEKGYHGEMEYMERNIDKRFNPELLVPETKSVIIVLVPYETKKPKLNSGFNIARYAVGKDYHFIVKERLNKLLGFLEELEPTVKGRAFVDSAPVMERSLAVKAGLGFIGKNGMLIHPEYGSYTFIGCLFTNATIQLKNPTIDNQCGDCNKCIRACPQGALTAMGSINSNKCISYKTIEQKSDFSPDENLRNYIFGCDICQEVCPFNQKQKPEAWPEFRIKQELQTLTVGELKTMGSSRFKKLFGDTALFRTGIKRLRRNVDSINNE